MKSFGSAVACLMVLAAAQAGAAAEWVKLGETKWGMVYYDKSSVRKVGRLVAASSKQDIRPEAAAGVAGALPDLAGVAYSIAQDVIDCEEGRYEITSLAFYDGHHRLLHDTVTDRGKYRDIGPRPIPPDTPIDWLAETVCTPGGPGAPR